MGYIYDSSNIRESGLDYFQIKKQEEDLKEKASEIKIFETQNSAPVDEKVNESNINKNFDIDRLVSKFKNEPGDVLDILELGFSDEQKKELRLLLTDKKKLKSFLNIAKNEALTASDILEGVKKSDAFKPSSVGKRIGNFFSKLFKEGVSEAVDYAKSETVYFAQKLGENMNEIREEREDFSSEGLADVSETITMQPEIKESTMHFVQKNSEPGVKLYTEKDVKKSVEFLSENTDKAEEYTANAVELEAITDDNGRVKYKGETILNTTERVTENSEIKSAAMAVAKKSDMTDEYLDNTTKNLFENPNMKEAIEFEATAKNENGEDKFCAKQVSGTSDHLLPKSADYCGSYAQNLEELSQNPNLSSSNILSIAESITAHPEIKNDVISKLNSGNYTGDEIANNASNCAKEASSNAAAQAAAGISQDTSGTSNTSSADSPIAKSRKNNETKALLDIVKNTVAKEEKIEKSFIQKTVINGQSYERSDVIRTLYKKYGPMAEKILQNLEKNPDFIEVIKTYGSNKILLSAAIDNPDVLKKLKSAGKLSNTELANVYEQCTNATSTEVMLQALDTTKNADKAIKITRKGRIFNNNDSALEILTSSKNITSKQKELDELYGVGTKREFSA